MNKLQNSAIPLILEIEEIQNKRFIGNLIISTSGEFYYHDVIIVMSFVHRTQPICV
jgi:hypothetical protein